METGNTQYMRKTVTLHIRKNTKNQSFFSHRPSNEKKNMFFVIPEMPSKTFGMVLKKLSATLFVHLGRADNSRGPAHLRELHLAQERLSRHRRPG